MSSNPLLKIPFAARVIQFASQTLSDALRLATVTSVFEETIYDYKVGQGILHHFDECIAQKKPSNLSVFLKRTIKVDDEYEKEFLHLLIDCFDRFPDDMQDIKSGAWDVSPRAGRDFSELAKDAPYEQKLDVFLSGLNVEKVSENMDFNFGQGVRISGTNYEVKKLAEVCAKNGLCRIFKALAVDWKGFKNAKINNKDVIFKRSMPFVGAPQQPPLELNRFTEVGIILSQCVYTAIWYHQRHFLSELFNTTTTTRIDGDDSENLSEKVYWDSTFPDIETIRHDMMSIKSQPSKSYRRTSTKRTKREDDDDDDDELFFIIPLVQGYVSILDAMRQNGYFPGPKSLIGDGQKKL